jgi:hypothetical protein
MSKKLDEKWYSSVYNDVAHEVRNYSQHYFDTLEEDIWNWFTILFQEEIKDAYYLTINVFQKPANEKDFYNQDNLEFFAKQICDFWISEVYKKKID